MIVRDQDRLGLYAVGMLVLLALAMCVSALFARSPSRPARPINGGSHAAVGVKASCVSACDHESHQTNLSDSGAQLGQIIYETPWHGSVPARGRTVRPVPGNVLQDMWGSNPHRAPSGAAAPKVTSVERHLGLVRLGSSTRRTATSSTKALTRRGAATQKPSLTCRYSRKSDRNSCPLCTLIRACSGSVGPSRSRDGVERHASTLVAEQSANRGARNASTIGRAGSMNPHGPYVLAGKAKARGLQWQERFATCAVPVAITKNSEPMRFRARRQLGRCETRQFSLLNAGEARRDRRGETRALRGRAARSARLAHNQEVAGSNPALATRSGRHEKSTRSGAGNGIGEPCDLSTRRGVVPAGTSTSGSDLYSLDAARAAIRKAGHRPNGGDEAARRAVWRSLVAQRGIRHYSKVARSNRVTAPHPKQLSKRVVSAQQKESATRLASVTLRVTGSAAARPYSIGGAA